MSKGGKHKNLSIRSLIWEKFKTDSAFSKAANIDSARLCRILSGQENFKIRMDEVSVWMELLGCEVSLLKPIMKGD